MTTTLSKTAAIKSASGHVSIHGRGTSWHIYGPYRASEPSGPSTESTADSYPKAVRIRTAWRARIALAMMGRLTDDAHWAVETHLDSYWLPHDLRSVVDAALEA